ncbi:hypothetical protein AGLY_012848, partial [Aphis glycines]
LLCLTINYQEKIDNSNIYYKTLIIIGILESGESDIMSEHIRELYQKPNIVDDIRKRRLFWAGHAWPSTTKKKKNNQQSNKYIIETIYIANELERYNNTFSDTMYLRCVSKQCPFTQFLIFQRGISFVQKKMLMILLGSDKFFYTDSMILLAVNRLLTRLLGVFNVLIFATKQNEIELKIARHNHNNLKHSYSRMVIDNKDDRRKNEITQIIFTEKLRTSVKKKVELIVIFTNHVLDY